MRSDRISYDLNGYNNSIGSSRFNWAQTPRNKQKTYQNGNVNVNTNNYNDNRRSVSPIRYQTNGINQQNNNNDRVSSSPLRIPLEQAISRCVRERSIDKSSSRRTLGKSSRLDPGSFVDNIKKITYQDQLSQKNIKAHSQTLKFIKKYFDLSFIIPTQQFISRILQQYGNLWDNQNLEQLLQDFTYKVHQIFGIDGIDPRVLILKTKNDGMLGLIMTIFKQLKEQQSTRNSNYTSFSRNPQVMSINKSFEQRLNYNQTISNNNINSNFTPYNNNIETIKNVVQEFMQSMYQCMQTQIYNKFNIQMRRMVLKYRQAEKIIKKVNQKITTHADFFELDDKLRKQKKYYEEKLGQGEKNQKKIQKQLDREKQNNGELKRLKINLQEQNKKLKQSMQKLQNLLINKALQSNNNIKDPTLSRLSTSPFNDRTHEYINMNNASNLINPLGLSNISCNQVQQQPFQIKIDTHFIQKQMGPPTTYTTTTFGNNGSMMPGSALPGVSPIKIKEDNKQNSFMEGRYSYSPYQSRFTGGSRLY